MLIFTFFCPYPLSAIMIYFIENLSGEKNDSVEICSNLCEGRSQTYSPTMAANDALCHYDNI